MTLRDLIIEYRRSHGLSQRQFAAQCGLSNAYISMIEKDINPSTNKPIVPTFRALQKIANGMGMTTNDLFAKADDIPVDITPLSEGSAAAPPAGFMPLPETVRLPVIGAIACGSPITAEENVQDYADVPATARADFCLLCKGNSMIDAGICDGDIVYIHKQETVENGQIAAVRVDNEATLKRFYFDGNKVTLLPANASYAPMIFVGDEINTVHIEGLAVGFYHKM